MSQWYQPGLFLLHYDHAYSPADDPPPGTGLDPEAIARLLREVRPDAVHYTAKGHPGYVPYATRFGNGLPPRLQDVDAPERDVLATYREITTELGIRLVLGYSGLIDYHAAGRWPHWLRLTTQHAPYPNRALCPNSGYVDELMLPQLAEILERYAPDGIWIDADNWTVSPCYCPVCESEYQMQHARSAPLDRRDPRWSEWLGFHRESFQRYLTRVGRYLHDRGPELVYASNGAFCT
ncbi:MAG TPA: alpha-L-fucosidase, partial [Armatimonadota bacterium]|nr:alpha-L-fucosidase [Armatimonadota bacterium]